MGTWKNKEDLQNMTAGKLASWQLTFKGGVIFVKSGPRSFSASASGVAKSREGVPRGPPKCFVKYGFYDALDQF